MNEYQWQVMWERQKLQQEFFNLDPCGMNSLARDAVAKDLALGLYEEATELVRDATHFKAHILNVVQIEKVNIADGVVDVLKYLVSIAQLYGVSDVDLFEAFMRKSDVVEDRARGERLALERDTRVIVSDLDNCISDLRHWQEEIGRAAGDGSMSDRMMKLIEDLKSDFYRGGGFRNIPVIDGARSGLEALRDAGFKIVLITARPAWQYKRLHADTRDWLEENNIPYDLLLFNKDKAEAIYERIFPARPTYFIEDRDKHCIEIAAIGVPVLLLDYPYNQSVAEGELITRVADWTEIVKLVLEAV